MNVSIIRVMNMEYVAIHLVVFVVLAGRDTWVMVQEMGEVALLRIPNFL